MFTAAGLIVWMLDDAVLSDGADVRFLHGTESSMDGISERKPHEIDSAALPAAGGGQRLGRAGAKKKGDPEALFIARRSVPLNQRNSTVFESGLHREVRPRLSQAPKHAGRL